MVSPDGNGPKRSICTVEKGVSGKGVILRGSSFCPPCGLTDKHIENLFTISSTSVSKPGHHSLERMNCLVLVIPICVECANFNALSLKPGGNTIL